MFAFFYADYCEGKFISPQDPWPAKKEQILHSMDCVLHMPSNFLGVVDEHKATLQFMVNPDRSILVDFPVPEEFGSYSKIMELSACFDLVAGLSAHISREGIEGLEFRAW